MAFGIDFGGSKKRESAELARTTEQTEERVQTEKLKLDQRAIAKIIEDVLSGPQGLASIFAGEQTAGIFDSSVAAQAAGDLTANLIGELAKLTAERVTTDVGVKRETVAQRTKGRQTATEIGLDFSFG